MRPRDCNAVTLLTDGLGGFIIRRIKDEGKAKNERIRGMNDMKRDCTKRLFVGVGKKILERSGCPRSAAMITGSVAEGISDNYSDLDMTVYLGNGEPPMNRTGEIRLENGAAERVWLLGDRAEDGIAEAYELHGIQAQIGHTTIAAWENEIAEVMERFNTDTPSHKAMSGTLESISVYSDEYMDRWKKKIAAYPDGLAHAMVEKHLTVGPGTCKSRWEQAMPHSGIIKF